MMVVVLEVAVHDVLPFTPYSESIVTQLARLDLASILVMAKLYLNSCEAVLGFVHPSSENAHYSL